MTVETEFVTVEAAVSSSTELWARDLKALYEHARDRFGDVSWETELGSERIWGHKAVIYARAPKAFKDRYFVSTSFSRSPTLRTPSPSPSFLAPPQFDSRATAPPTSFRHPNDYLTAPSRLSVHSTLSDFTVRAPAENVLRLPHGDTPELFQAQLEWLYTGEGFADVVEWISEDDNVRSIRDSLGRHGSQDERRDKLGQDLTYMWRSKLYVDVRIHLTPLLADEKESDSDDSTDSLSSTSVFTAHRFILVSRSPYFSSLLLNHSAFRPASAGGVGDIHLPTPPFTPASLHFCLGWMYAGHLDFSNRSFDLGTAFQIHRAAAYLQLDSLVAEIESRIVWDFCHGLDVSKCRCKKCSNRVARIWRFASAPEVAANALKERARRYMVKAWGDCWSRDVGTLDEDGRAEVVRDVANSIGWRNIVATFRSITTVRTRMETALRAKGAAATWTDPLAVMVDQIEAKAKEILVQDFDRIADGQELWALLQGKGFSDDVLEEVLQQLVDAVGTPSYCKAAPRVYQTLVSSVLLKVHPDTLETILSPRSIGRHRIETAKSGVLGHIRRRWLQIRDQGGFASLENWSIKEIADEIEVDLDELFEMSISPAPTRHTPQTTRAGIPRTMSQSASLHQASTLTLGSGRPTSRNRPGIPADMRDPPLGEAAAAGLRRLRLSSSASTASRSSIRSITSPAAGMAMSAGLAGSGGSRERDSLRIRAVSSSPTAVPQGPRARSPTAERAGKRVSIGLARRGESDRPLSGLSASASASDSQAGSVRTAGKRDSQILSGPIRQLMAKGSIGSAAGATVKDDGLGGGEVQSGAEAISVTGAGLSADKKGKGKARASDAVHLGAPIRTPSSTSGSGGIASTGTAERSGRQDAKGKGRATEILAPTSPKKAPSIVSVRSTRTTKSQVSTAPTVNKRNAAAAAEPMPMPNKGTSSSAIRKTATSRLPAGALATRSPAVRSEASTPRSRVTSTTTATSVAPSARTRMASAATVRSTTSTRTDATAPTAGPSSRATSQAQVLNPTGLLPAATVKSPKTPTLSPARSVPDLKKANSNADSDSHVTSVTSASRSVRPRMPSAVSSATARSPSKTAASTSGARSRTTSQATAASVRSTAHSVASTVRAKADNGKGRAEVLPPMPTVRAVSASPQKPPPVPAKTPAVPTRTRVTSQASTASNASRATTSRSSRPTPPVAMPTLHPPAMRSASASTAEETEARTPRSSDPGSIIIRKPSEYADEPSAMSPFPHTPIPMPFPPVAITASRNDRKVSSGSVRSQASTRRHFHHPASAFDPPKRMEIVSLKDVPLPDGVKPYNGPGISLTVGIPCIVNLNLEGRKGRFKAQVKYIGFMANSKGPWIGVETDALDRIGVPTLPSGIKADTHYFHFTSPDPLSPGSGSDGEQEVQHEQRMMRQRKIEQIRMGLRDRKNSGVGARGGTAAKVRNGSLGVGYPGKGGVVSRATSPYAGHASGADWVSGEMRALFVRPSEVVYVVGAE